jgi:hypothetical protein
MKVLLGVAPGVDVLQHFDAVDRVADQRPLAVYQLEMRQDRQIDPC